MSFPSVKAFLSAQGVDSDTATDDQLRQALHNALLSDLSLGWRHLSHLAHDCQYAEITKDPAGARLLNIQDPASPLGKQLIRLLGSDIARGVCEQEMGVAFALYNCCTIVVAPTREQLKLSRREQVKLQDGTIEFANC